MPSTRKSRNVNKKYSKVNEESPDKDGGSGKKNKQRKRKLSDMVGPQWSKEELECFYEAYRKYKKDWKKVSSVIRNRSAEMVEALYNINRAYLSLQEREVSAAGLIAMMTDHYNMLEGSDSDRESNDGSGLQRKPQKRARAKFKVNNSKGSEEPVPDLLQNFSSSYGCLPLLKKKRCGGTRPRAVGKRTPRFPVSFPFDKGGRARFISPSKRDLDSEVDPDDDDVAHVVARALAEASQRGGSPQVSRTPSRGTEHVRQSPVHNGEKKNPEAGMDGSKLVDAMSEDCLEGSLESREAETGDTSRTTSHRGLLDTEGAFSAQIQRKAKKFRGKNQKNHGIENNQFDDVREACSGTEEGLSLSPVKDKSESEVAGGRNMKSTPESTKKRGRQLFFGDESSALDALQTLADLSLNILFPSSTVESESSIQVKAEKRGANAVHKPSAPESISANLQIDKSRISKDKEKGHSSVHGADTVAIDNARSGKDPPLDAGSVSEIKHRLNPSANTLRKGKRKSSNGKIPHIELHNDSHPCDSQKTEVLAGEGKRSTSKSKQVSQTVVQPKHGKSVKPERSSSTDLGRNGTDLTESVVQVPTLNQGSLPIRRGSRRKMELQKSLVRKELKTVENVANDRSTVNSRTPKYLHSVHDRVVSLKDKLSHCLSSQLLRRWCTFEWFYSAIDYPWFARSEFVEYLNHVGLGHVPRLTRVEWGVIRSSLGKPRRLSEQFLREEREKLEQYRESVRTHYTELRTGIRDGLATDLARPLSVGQRVIACHPKTREIHDGSILTVDRNRCRVQFDRPELGVEFVMDIDCMPLNPLENLPEVLRRQNIGAENFREDSNEAKLDVKPKDWKAGVYTKFTSGENSGIAMDGPFHVAPSNYPMSTLFKQAKGDTLDAIMQAKAAVNQVAVAAQQAMYTQPCTFAQIQAREDDIKALAGLTRALDKKEALLMELRHMNEEVSSNQKDGESVRDSENFKKQYAMVLVQLKDANDQVASALFYLRQRNTYQDNSPPWPKSSVNGGLAGTFDNTFPLVQDSGCHVMEVVENSRKKARTMVDAAVQAMSSLKEGENPFERVGKATDLANNRHSGTDAGILAGRSCPLSDPGHGTSSSHQDQATSCTSEPTAAAYASSPKQNNSSERNEVQLPSELISSCVATLLMIQTCTERQYPPAEMAQILDTAVTNLQPCCPQNIAIYAEIQQLMGIVKNQILALLPTQHIVLPPELPAG